MVRAPQARPGSFTARIVDRISQSNQLNRQEHLYLASALLGSQRLSQEERRSINQIFDRIQSGRIRIVDEIAE
jgi:hypothetical protein